MGFVVWVVGSLLVFVGFVAWVRRWVCRLPIGFAVGFVVRQLGLPFVVKSFM